MAKAPPNQKWSNQFIAYWQILYQAYFQPFTLQYWLATLEPRVNVNDNLLFLLKWAKITQNPQLKLYASRILSLTVVIPLVTMVLVAPIYTFISSQQFNWLANLLFILSWLLSLLMVCRWFYRAVAAALAIALVLGVIFPWTPPLIKMILLPVIWGLITGAISAIISDARFSLIFGVGLGVGSIIGWQMPWHSLSGMLLSSVLEILLGAASGVALGLVWITSSGVNKGILAGIGWGLISAIVLSLTSSWEWGLTWGITFILGVLRFYFWLPELLWSWLIFWISRREKDPDWLFYLPFSFDELIILPLPFQARIIADLYPRNPPLVKERINYLLRFTNQQQVGIQAMTYIALHILKRCETIEDIATINDRLAWMIVSSGSSLHPWLPSFLQISQEVQSSLVAYSLSRQAELIESPMRTLLGLRQYRHRHKKIVLVPWQQVVEKWLKILTL